MNIIHYSFVFFLISIFQLSVEGQRNAGCVRPRIENGRAKVRARGKMVYFRCRKKFTRIGPKFAVCLPNSVWSQPAPICIGRGCPTIVPKDGLQISGEYDGAMLKFTCPAGMKRKGPESIHCNGKKWNAGQPSCVGNNGSIGISLQCDFEKEELCGWSQSDDDDFEWTWFSGKTPTINTGPLHDHTHAANSSGHYLFIESSSPRKPLDRAVLASPLYQAQYSNTCFEFWYHMQGPDEENAVGSLEVFVKPESLTINDIDPEFIMEGNQGPDWKRGSIYIEGQTEVFQIMIVGTRKEAFVSDIAIDDVRMYNCSEDSITDETDSTTSESISDSPDAQSSVVTQKITSTTNSGPKTNGTTKTINVSTRKPTTTVTKPPNMKTTTPRLTSRKIPTTIRKTTSIMKTSMKTTPKPKTTQTLSTTQIKTTMSTPTTLKTTKRATFKSTMPIKTTTTTTRRRSSTKPTIPQTKTTVKSTTPRKATKSTSWNPSPPNRTSKKANDTKSSITPSTTTPFTNITKKSTTKQTYITPITDAIKPRSSLSTKKATHSKTSSVSLPFMGSTTIPRAATNGTDTVNINQTDIGIGETQTSLGRTGGISMTPLIIGISCGIAVGVLVIVILAYMWVRRQRNKLSDETIEEMAPITNAEGGYYHPS